MSDLVYTGTVKKVFERGGRHSLLMDDDQWYGLGRNAAPGVFDGATVRFSWVQNGKYKNITEGTVQVKEGAPTQTKSYTQKASGGASDYAKKEKYWLDKEQRDIDTQKRISYQAAMNTSINLVNTMLEGGFMTAPKGKVADKHEAYMAMVYETADELFRVYQTLPENADEILAAGTVDTSIDVKEGMQAQGEEKQEEGNDDWN